jgi:hypothetical protein
MNTVWDKLPANQYQNPDPYPTRLHKPALRKMVTADDHRAYADQLEAYEAAREGFQAARAAWAHKSLALERQFREDLEHYYEMVGHPKADLLYGKAYELSHSGGLEEIANTYSDLVELVK